MFLGHVRQRTLLVNPCHALIYQTNSLLKEHNHGFALAQEFDFFWTGGQEFKDAKIDVELPQIRLHRPQSTLALPLNFSESKISDTRFS